MQSVEQTVVDVIVAMILCYIGIFGIVFVITMFAFSMMLHIQLGPVMEQYMGQLYVRFSDGRSAVAQQLHADAPRRTHAQGD